jgi:hypothetical protein
VLNNPRGAFTINRNARAFLHPPGIEIASDQAGGGGSSGPASGSNARNRHQYERLTHPLPALSHAAYPFYTPGGGDKRWLMSGTLEEEGQQWVGGLMSVCRLAFESMRIMTPQLELPLQVDRSDHKFSDKPAVG